MVPKPPIVWISAYIILCLAWPLMSTAFLRPTTQYRSQLHGTNTMIPFCEYHQLDISSPDPGAKPRQDITVVDLTNDVVRLLQASEMVNGTITVISRHTTTSIVINEYESRLARDIAATYRRLVPPDERSVQGVATVRYQHNDIDQRPESADEAARCVENGWDISNVTVLQAWRDQEPVNAHSHLLSMLLGSSESIPVVNHSMVIGQWQSILLIDLDGPRKRTVGVQLSGFR